MSAETQRVGQADPGPQTHVVAERLGPYRLVQRIGEGGMGVVHLALDPHGRAVAIKVLRAHIAHDAEARARLEREVQTLARVRHPRVAPVVDHNLHGDRPYVVTRYIAGDALDDRVAEHGPLPGDELLRLARGLHGALDAIHRAGVVHRDLKPGNVLLDEDGDPVVIDFGIAHVADDVRLTSTGLVMGTPGYLSPEVIEGAAVTPATDWWGWAATLAFAATGRPPFGRGPMDVVLARVRAGEFDLDGVDPRLEPLLAAALSPRPPERPSDQLVLSAIERYAAGSPATEVLPPPVGPTAAVSGRQTEVIGTGPGAAAPALRSPAAPAAPVEPAGPGPLAEPIRQPWQQPAPWPAQPAWHAPDAWQQPGWGAPAGATPDGHPQEWGQVPPDGGQPWVGTGEVDPRIGRPDRSGVLLGGAALLLSLAAVAPLVAGGLALGWSWLSRVADRSVTGLLLRRHQYGRRRSDLPVAVAMTPVHVLGGALATTLAALLPVLVGGAGAVLVALGVASINRSAPQLFHPVTLGTAAALALLTAWWGPGGASLRRGAKSLARAVPDGLGADVATGLLIAGSLLVLGWAFLRGWQPLWWPMSGPPAWGL